MYIFLLIILLFFPIALGIYKHTSKKGTVILNIPFLLFFPIQLLLSPFTITQSIGFENYTIISYAIFFSTLIFLLSFLVISLIKNHKEFRFKNIFIYCIYSSLLLIMLLVLLFTYYSSIHTNHDLNYYINISKNFSYSIYSSGPLVYDEAGNLISSLSNHYLSPQMYYLYGSFFKNNLSISYFLINPIFYGLIAILIIDSIIDIFFKKNIFIYKIIGSIISIALAIGSLYIFVPSMNHATQALAIVILFINIKTSKNNNLLSYIPFYTLSFFSSTGLILSLICTFVLWLNFQIKDKSKNTTIYLLFIIFILVNSLFIFSNRFTQIGKIFTIGIVYSMSFITFGMFFINYLLIKKDKIYFYKFNSNGLKEKERNNKIVFASILILFSLTILYIFLNNYVFIEMISPNTLQYDKNLSFFSLILYILLTILFSVEYFKNNKFNKFIIYAFIIAFLSSSELLMSAIVFDNASAWRLIYLIFGMGTTIDTAAIVFSILCIYKNILWSSNLKIIRKIKNYSHSNRVQISLSGIIMAAATITPITLSYVPYNGVYSELSFSSNIYKNMHFLNKNDKLLVQNIDFKNYTQTYVTDMPVYQYINKGVDLTGYLNSQIVDGEIYSISSYEWNYSNFYNGLWRWNKKYENDKIKEDDPNSVIQCIDRLLNNLQSFNLTTWSGEEITNVNYFILSKTTSYFELTKNYLLENGYEFIKDGIDIAIFSKNSSL